MQSQICLAPRTVCGCTLDAHPRGWVRRAGNTPPCAASFFPYSFFAGEERMEPPEGDSKRAWKKLGCEKPPTTPASKLAPCVVSASAAASGLLTRPDNGCSHKSAWHPVQCAAVVPTPYQGWVLRAGPPALSGVFLPLFFLRRRRKNGAPGGR